MVTKKPPIARTNKERATNDAAKMRRNRVVFLVTDEELQELLNKAARDRDQLGPWARRILLLTP